MRRHLLNFLTALSLVLCVAVVGLWLRSHWSAAGDESLGLPVGGGGTRYTVRSAGARLTLYGPPPPAGAAPPVPLPPPNAWQVNSDLLWRTKLTSLAPDVTPRQAVAAIHNDQICWEVSRQYLRTFRAMKPGDDPWRPHFSPRGRPGTPAQKLAPWDPVDEFEDGDLPRHRPFPAAALTPALLAALEDPHRWLAAHVVLTRLHLYPDPHYTQRFGPPFGDAWVHDFNGLRAELRPEGPALKWTDDGSDGDYYRVQPCVARIDPDQRQELVRQWHRKLDVPLASTRHAVVAGVLFLLPAARSAAAVYRRHRHRHRADRNLCPSCGYDLRATPGRCPECGAAAPEDAA